MEKQTLKLQRIVLGILGLAFIPLLPLMHHGILLRSISHYYYTGSAVVFIAILSSFGLLLISYRGHPKASWEKFSDHTITTIAGIAAIMIVLVPTASDGVPGLDFSDQPYLFAYTQGWGRNITHLVSAAVFISLLGYMCYFKFTLSRNNSRGLNRYYKVSGQVVWGSVLLLAILIILERVIGLPVNDWLPSYVFWLEAAAIWSFSLAWLRKGLG